MLVDSTHAATVVSGSYYLESGRLEVFVEIACFPSWTSGVRIPSPALTAPS